MTPGEAIRKYCVECVGSVYQTEDCGGNNLHLTGKPCPLYEFRSSRGRPSVKIIRQECVSVCMNGNSRFVKECEKNDCFLHSFRLGKNPNFKLTDDQKKERAERLKPEQMAIRKNVLADE